MNIGNPFAVPGKVETEILSVVVAQLSPRSVYTWEDLDYNIDLHVEYMEKAAASYPGYDLRVFPEDVFQTFVPGFYHKFEMKLDDKRFDRIKEKCRELSVWAVISPWIVHEGTEKLVFENTAILINDRGEIVHKHVKNFPATPVESTYPGDDTKVVDGPKGSKIAMIVCYDGDFPEAWREAAYNGANVIIRVSDYFTPSDHQWAISNQAAAYQNKVYVVASNMAQINEVYQPFGDSMIVGPDGRIISKATQGTPGLIKADLYPGIIDHYRNNSGMCNYIHTFNHRGAASLGYHGEGKDLSSFIAYRDSVKNRK